MPLFEVKAGGSNIPDGVYPVHLGDIKGPKTVVAARGPNAGEEVTLFDWIFYITMPGDALDGQEISGSTSSSSGPRSKMFAWLTALHNGAAPAVGTSFEKDQLVGRMALATIQRDTEGWPRLVNLGAMPASMLQQGFAAATGTTAAPLPAQNAPQATAAPAVASTLPHQQIVPPQPVAARPAPVAAGAGAPADELPF